MTYYALIVFLTIAATLEGFETADVSRHVKLLAAMCEVESGGDCSKIGLADELGCYQILEPYWFDALEHDPSIGGVYEDVLDKEYSEKVIYSFWDRYATKERLGRPVTDEDRARMHNKGPNGYKKDSSIPYWNKVNKILNE
jgi:hypothetical protein